ncbi:hypothetical protein [Gorillibacterium sp. CAU 1737]|uniref:hypothetical protein n=1 Tax=Gorillibacterium sp. CAU 1737 TaxID=3140362 RepID=UPI0032614E7C
MNRHSFREWKKWQVIVGVISILLLVGIIWSIPRFQDKAFELDGHKYRLAEEKDGERIYRSFPRDRPVIRVKGEEAGERYQVSIGKVQVSIDFEYEAEHGKVYQVTDSVGTRKVKVPLYGGWIEVEQPDGTFFPEFVTTMQTTGLGEVNKIEGGFLYPADVLIRIVDPARQEKDGQPGYYVIGFLLLAVSFLSWRFRDFFFYLKYAANVESPEPTDFYITSTKISAIIIAIVGAGLLFFGIVSVV